MDDVELLREYTERRSEAAFAELVRRHIDTVYSSALRLVNDPGGAADVTQLVFIRLSRKAGSLHKSVLLTGWLYRTTQFVARTMLRSEWRRRKREGLAMEVSELNQDAESTWRDIAPRLEAAMAQLRSADQDAILLRFFAGKSLREVGEMLGVNDDTAQKRVQRALERLREYLTRRGAVVPLALLASVLAAQTVQAAPPQLASSVATAAVSAGGFGCAGSLQVFKTMVGMKLHAHGFGTAVVFLLVIGAVVTLMQNPASSARATNDLSHAVFVVRGRVQFTNGNPVAGARIDLAAMGSMVRLYYLTNRVPTNAQVSKTWTTSAVDGTFALGLPTMPRDGKAVVAVSGDAGYALATAADLSLNSNLVVQPWGRIEGTLRIGKSVAINQTVNIGIWGASETYEWTLVSHGWSVQTDGNGRFVFPRVAPGDVWLTRNVIVRPGEGRQSGHHYIRVKPGETFRVTLGGAGCAVVGRVEHGFGTNLLFYGSMWARESHGMRPPREWRRMASEEKRLHVRAWRDSPQSEPFKREVRNYEFPVRPDGTFRVEDVLPGSYRMQVRADAPAVPGESRRIAAKVELQIEVPEPLEPGELIDVGILTPAATPSDR